MVVTHECPLCNDTYEGESRLLVHLEVEHRKSELATYVVDGREPTTDPAAERERTTPTV